MFEPSLHHREPVPNGEQDLLHALIGGQPIVEALLDMTDPAFGLVIQHATFSEGVVVEDQAIVREPYQEFLLLRGVAFLVGIHEREINERFLGQRPARRP